MDVRSKSTARHPAESQGPGKSPGICRNARPFQGLNPSPRGSRIPACCSAHLSHRSSGEFSALHPRPIPRHRRRDVHLRTNPLQRAAGNPQPRRNLRTRPGPDVLVELGTFEESHGEVSCPVVRFCVWWILIRSCSRCRARCGRKSKSRCLTDRRKFWSAFSWLWDFQRAADFPG